MMLFILCTGAGIAQVHPSQDPNYTLVFHEDFNGLDSNGLTIMDKDEYLNQNWMSAYPYNQVLPTKVKGEPWDFDEMMKFRAYYTNYDELSEGFRTSFPNVKVENGYAQIEARKEEYEGAFIGRDTIIIGTDTTIRDNPYTYNFNYTMGMLRSRRPFRYGFMEAEIEFSVSEDNKNDYFGVGANVWMSGGHAGNIWSAISEIDLLESCSNKEYNGVEYVPYGAVNEHYGEFCLPEDNDCDPSRQSMVDTGEKFPYPVGFAENGKFTLGVRWTEEAISFYRNGHLHAVSTENNPGGDRAPEHIFLDLNHPTHQYGFDSVGVNNIYPFVLKVYDVKYYQNKEICNGDMMITKPVGYRELMEEIVFRNITIGGEEELDLNADGYEFFQKPWVDTDFNLNATKEIYFKEGVTFSAITNEEKQELTAKIVDCE